MKNSKIPSEALRLNHLHHIWIFLLFCGIGIVTASFNEAEELHFEGHMAVRGKVIDKSALTSGDRLLIEVMQVQHATGGLVSPANLKMWVYGEPNNIRRGDIVTMTGNVKRLADSPNRLPSGYAERMSRKGILYTMHLEKDSYPTVEACKGDIFDSASDFRDRLEVFIEHTGLARSTKNFIITLLLGDREYLDETILRSFAGAGVAHVLALSGMHVGIIAALILTVLFPFNFIGRYKLRYALTIVMLWGFALLTGMGHTTVRAAILTSVCFIAILLERKNSMLNALCVAVFFILFFSPSALFDVGMQLSVVCVASLILFANQLNPVMRHDHPYLYKIASAVISTLVATAGSWVISAYCFKTVPLLFLPANLLMLPLLPWFIGFTLLSLLLEGAGIPNALLNSLLDRALDFLTGIADVFSGEGSAMPVNIGAPTVWIWIAGLVLMAVSLDSHLRIKRTYRIFGAGMLAVAIITIPLFCAHSPEGYIIQDTYGSIAVRSYAGGQEIVVEMPRGEIGLVEICGEKILSLDDELTATDLCEICASPKWMIVGSNFKGNIKEIVEKVSPENVVIHSSVYSKREKYMMRELDPGVEVYSLRDNGPIQNFK